MKLPHLVVGDRSGNFLEIPELYMAGMNLVKPVLPQLEGLLETKPNNLVILPNRVPIGYDADLQKFVQLREFDSKPVYPLGAKLPAGELQLLRSAFSTMLDAPRLAPHTYAAAGCLDGNYFAAASAVGAPLREGIKSVSGNPDIVRELCRAGYKSIAIKLNSARKAYYDAFYAKEVFHYDHLYECLEIISENHVEAGLCYLTFPGLTDHPDEIAAFSDLLRDAGVRFVQLQNLEIDPDWYIEELGLFTLTRSHIGMYHWLAKIKNDFPNVVIG